MSYTSLSNWYENAFLSTRLQKHMTYAEYNMMHPFEYELFELMYENHVKAENDKAKMQASLQAALERKGYA